MAVDTRKGGYRYKRKTTATKKAGAFTSSCLKYGKRQICLSNKNYF